MAHVSPTLSEVGAGFRRQVLEHRIVVGFSRGDELWRRAVLADVGPVVEHRVQVHRGLVRFLVPVRILNVLFSDRGAEVDLA